jgi:D-amino peptidase
MKGRFLTMKILIAADMEGVSGVVHWDHVDSKHPEYSRFRQIMTDDVNAAIQGAMAAGADEIIVADGHGSGRNILIEQLDPHAHLCSGTPSPFSMVQGIDTGVEGVLFVGYHAKIGSPHAILEHTWSDERVANFWLKSADQEEFLTFGEIGLNAAVCGHFGAPVLMISGDLAACNEASGLLGEIETAVVKWASSRMAAECLPPEESQRRIQQAAFQAITRLISTQSSGVEWKPLTLVPPITFAIDFVQSEMADKAALLPGALRNGRRIEYTAGDIVTIYRAFRTAIALAAR